MSIERRKQELNSQLHSFCVEGRKIGVLLRENRKCGEYLIEVGHLKSYKFIELLDKTTLFLTSNAGSPVFDKLFTDYLIYDSHPTAFIKDRNGVDTHVVLNNVCQDLMKIRIGVFELLRITPSIEDKITREVSSAFSLKNYQSTLCADMIRDESLEKFQSAWQNIAEATKQGKKDIIISNLYLISSFLQEEISVVQFSSSEIFNALNSWSELIELKAAQMEANCVKLTYAMDRIFPNWFLNPNSIEKLLSRETSTDEPNT
jgi:hypothetical protein